MTLHDIFAEMIERQMPVNSILREVDYKLGLEQRQELRNMLIESNINPYHDGNDAEYRLLRLQDEVRLEFLTGVPANDIPDFLDVAVNTVDFTFDKRQKNWLKSYQYRKGSIRYKFNASKMTEVAPNLFIVSSLLANGQTIAVGRFDGKPGFMVIDKKGVDILGTEYAITKDFTYSVVGHYGDRLILHYVNL